MPSTILLIFSTSVSGFLFLRFLLSFTHDAREPLALETKIPFISPMIGMRKKGKFYTDLRDKFNLPIYTLRIPFRRLYIINSTELIPLVQKHYRILDFAPMEAKVAMNVMGAGPHGRKTLFRDCDGVEDFGYAILFDKAIHPAVSPGPFLDAMDRWSVRKVAESVETLASQAPRSMKLFEWVKREITLTTTDAVYGLENPFRSARIREAYWKFESGIVLLLLNLYPNLFARQSVQAREEIVDALDDYFFFRSHEKDTAFVQPHYQHKVDQGVRGKDIARLEIGGIVTILANTIPTAFWVLYHAISDADVLEECKREIIACCKIDGQNCTLDITEVKTSCSVLLSILKESLQFHGIGTSARVVTEDHLLDGRYLLKKGGIVMIPGPVQHSSKPAYRDHVGKFEHKRFVRSPDSPRSSSVASRGLGGDSTLCPGRHFATTEVLAFVALMIVRFDFEPIQGAWVCPKTDNAGMQGTIAPPNEDVEVRLLPTTGELAGKRWNVVLSGYDKGLELSVQDF